MAEGRIEMEQPGPGEDVGFVRVIRVVVDW